MPRLSEKAIVITIRSIAVYFLLALFVPFLNPIDLRVSLLNSYSTLQKLDVYGLMSALVPDLMNALYFFIIVFLLCFIAIIAGVVMTFINDKLNKIGEITIFIMAVAQVLALLVMTILFIFKDFVIEVTFSIGTFATFIMSAILLILLMLKRKASTCFNFEQTGSVFSCLNHESPVCLDDNQNPYIGKGLNELFSMRHSVFQQSSYPAQGGFYTQQQYSALYTPPNNEPPIFQYDNQNSYGSYGQMSPTPGLNESQPTWNFGVSGYDSYGVHQNNIIEIPHNTDFGSMFSSHNSYFQDKLNNNFFQ